MWKTELAIIVEHSYEVLRKTIGTQRSKCHIRGTRADKLICRGQLEPKKVKTNLMGGIKIATRSYTGFPKKRSFSYFDPYNLIKRA